MFMRSDDVTAARQQLLEQTKQPKKGTIIYGFNRLPIRVRFQVRERRAGAEKEIFAYATLVASDGVFDLSQEQRHIARDFSSTEYRGAKAILLVNARNQLLARYADDPMLATCDVLPVKALRVVEVALSKLSVTCEIAEYCTPEEAEICAALVAATEPEMQRNTSLETALGGYNEELRRLGAA